MIRNNLREKALQGTKQVSEQFEKNPEIQAMIQPYSKAFRDCYREAYELFVQGEWGRAHQKFL